MSIQEFTEEATAYDFYQAVYLVERQLSPEDKEWLGVGQDGFPSKELVRFKSDQHLGFPGVAISKAKVVKEEGNLNWVDIYVSFMGLTGPSGVLPRHYSELLLQCIKNRDTAMRDFFDLFNHRLISLNYRAWKKYRMAMHYEQQGQNLSDAFSKALLSLTGGSKPLHIHYGGWLNKVNRSAEGLRSILRDYLNCDVQVDELQGRWVSLDRADQTCLASRFNPEGQYARLGSEATLGSKVWDISSSVRVIVKPASPQLVNQLKPGSQLYKALKDLIASYVDDGLDVKLNVQTTLGDLPLSSLGDSNSCLGQSARLSHRPLNNQTTISI